MGIRAKEKQFSPFWAGSLGRAYLTPLGSGFPFKTRRWRKEHQRCSAVNQCRSLRALLNVTSLAKCAEWYSGKRKVQYEGRNCWFLGPVGPCLGKHRGGIELSGLHGAHYHPCALAEFSVSAILLIPYPRMINNWWYRKWNIIIKYMMKRKTNRRWILLFHFHYHSEYEDMSSFSSLPEIF